MENSESIRERIKAIEDGKMKIPEGHIRRMQLKQERKSLRKALELEKRK